MLLIVLLVKKNISKDFILDNTIEPTIMIRVLNYSKKNIIILLRIPMVGNTIGVAVRKR